MQLQNLRVIKEGIDLFSLHGFVVELESIELYGEDDGHALEAHPFFYCNFWLTSWAFHSLQFLWH